MTRINCIPVNELTTKHLVAEYRELPRLAKHAKQKYDKNPAFTPPATYRLGKGHMDFFVDKGAWLSARFAELVKEMQHRGYITNFISYPKDIHPQDWMGSWKPTKQAVMVNKQRIAERLR